MLKYPSGGGVGGGGLNFMHENQTPSYIKNARKDNYVNSLNEVRKTMPKSFSFSFL